MNKHQIIIKLEAEIDECNDALTGINIELHQVDCALARNNLLATARYFANKKKKLRTELRSINHPFKRLFGLS